MKVTLFDLETSNLSADFGIVLCAVVKQFTDPLDAEVTQSKPKVYRIDSKKGVKMSDDSHVVKAIIETLSDSDILIAHNGVKFDRPYLNTRALKHNLAILNPNGKIIDPVKLARKHLRLTYNSLNQVASILGTKQQKTLVDGQTWMKATLDRDKEAMDYIVEHCVADVLVLEETVARLRKFVGNITPWGSD